MTGPRYKIQRVALESFQPIDLDEPAGFEFDGWAIDTREHVATVIVLWRRVDQFPAPAVKEAPPAVLREARTKTDPSKRVPRKAKALR